MDPEMESGLADLGRRFNSVGLQVIERKRLWPNRMATYLALGKPDRSTDIVLSDEFLSDLPNTTQYQLAVDSYASAVAGRIKCGSPEAFYCLSGVAIRIEINWPIEAAIVGSAFTVWLRVDVRNQADGTLAKYSVALERFPFGSDKTVFDEVRLVINRIRTFVDENKIIFYSADTHPAEYQQIKRDWDHTSHVAPKPKLSGFSQAKRTF
jgi:hypothetical protein